MQGAFAKGEINIAISGKNRRTIFVSGTKYIWYVRNEEDGIFVGAPLALTIISEDKRLHITLPIGQTGSHPFVVLKGTGLKGAWKRVACPSWMVDGVIITPKNVRKILLWFQSEPDFHYVDYLGQSEASAD